MKRLMLGLPERHGQAPGQRLHLALTRAAARAQQQGEPATEAAVELHAL